MTTFERFERSIPELMTELAPARVPDYFDDMLQQTAGATQRPAWSYPERWLPVEITARPLSMRSFPWRSLLVLALVAGLIAAGLALYVGSQNRVPPPFGLARNGVLMYRGTDGAIVSLDPASGAQATVVSAADAARADPVPSRDGRRIALAHFGDVSFAPIVITDIGGRNRVTLAGDYREVDALDWSPDDSHVAIVSNVDGLQSITVATADGSAAKSISLGRQVFVIAYLADGRLAMIAAERSGQECPGNNSTTAPCALFVMDADGAGLDELIPPAEFHGINTISPSPDGTKLLWVEWKVGAGTVQSPDFPGRLHIYDLSTHADHRLADDAFPAAYNINRAWFSPDGSSILFDFFEAADNHWGIVPSAGGAPARVGPAWPAQTDAAWAPDGKSVLVSFAKNGTTSDLWLVDPTGSGGDRKLQATVPYLPPWQRLAP